MASCLEDRVAYLGVQAACLGDPEEDSFLEGEVDQEACLVAQVASSFQEGVEVEEGEHHPCLEEEVGAEGSCLIALRLEEEEVEVEDFHPFQEGEVGEEAYSFLEEEGYLRAVANTTDRIVI